ncbi:MAG: hypothetical protein ABEJ27_01520 [Halodesulfurarchaeum sp.]
MSERVCLNCQFAAASGSETWNRVEHPTLGSMTQCPECGSTNIQMRR